MKSRRRVLLVGPELNSLETLAQSLGRCGYRVSRAHDRKSALPLMFEVHPHLVLLYALPVPGDSWELVSQIRRFTDDPVVLIGHERGTAEAEHGMNLGADACLAADVPWGALIDIVNQLLKRRAPSKSEHGIPLRHRRQAPQVRLRFLTPAQLAQIDRALAEVGAQGEVRLVKTRGRLRVITKVATRVILPAGA